MTLSSLPRTSHTEHSYTEHVDAHSDPRDGLVRGSGEWLILSCILCCGLGRVWGDWNLDGETCPSCNGTGLASETTTRLRNAQRLAAQCL